MRLIASLLSIYYCISSIASAVQVSVNLNDHRVYVEGKPFFFKGLNYLPIPVGYNPWNIDVFDDTRIIDRDIELLKYLNINSVRIHHISTKNPETKRYMLDKLYENGIYAVLCRTFNDNNRNWADPAVRKATMDDWVDLVTTYKDHPAVVMWMFGNELNQPTKWNVPAAFSMMKEIKDMTHKLEGPDNWHPLTTALIDGNTAQTIMMIVLMFGAIRVIEELVFMD
jgi:beta-galactosidase/beta-glucuronidase